MDTGIEQRLRTSLRTSAEDVTVPDDLPARVERRIRGRRRQALGLRVAAGALAVVALGAVAVVAGDDDGSTEMLPPAVGTPAEGMWEPLPEAPISPRFQHAAVWTGEEMIVFGGYEGAEEADGAAAYSPATGVWRQLADPPDELEGSPVAVWTGTDVVAFAGDHGASYDPETDEWRTVAGPDVELGMVMSPAMHAVWTGQQVLLTWIFGSDEDDDAGTGAALYDPATGAWARLPDASEALSRGAAAWTGDELVFVEHEPGTGSRAPRRMFAVALDPATATWRTLPAPPLTVRGSPLVAWTGHEIVVGGGYDFGSSDFSADHEDAAAYDPLTGAWRPLPDAPTAFEGVPRYVDVAVDGRVVAFDTTDPEGRVLVLDPATGLWRFAPGPNRPEPTEPGELPGRRDAPVVSTGTAALVWGGGLAQSEGDRSWGCCRAVGEGALFTPPPAGR